MYKVLNRYSIHLNCLSSRLSWHRGKVFSLGKRIPGWGVLDFSRVHGDNRKKSLCKANFILTIIYIDRMVLYIYVNGSVFTLTCMFSARFVNNFILSLKF